MRIAYQSRNSVHFFIAEEPKDRPNGLRYGRLVNLKTHGCGALLPIASIARHMPDEDFVPFQGDPGPALAILRRAEEQANEEASGDAS